MAEIYLNLEAAVDHRKYKKYVYNFANPSLHSTFYLLAKIPNICNVYSYLYFEYACHYTPNTLLPCCDDIEDSSDMLKPTESFSWHMYNSVRNE